MIYLILSPKIKIISKNHYWMWSNTQEIFIFGRCMRYAEGKKGEGKVKKRFYR